MLWFQYVWLLPNSNVEVSVPKAVALGFVRSWGWSLQEWDEPFYKTDLRDLFCPFYRVRTW